MLLPKRIWKDIPGYEGVYQVSNTGQVRTFNYKLTGQTKILKPAKDKDGYLLIGLKGKSCRVHRLVAQAFIPNPDNLPCINHKDENPANNAVWNLEWCTYKYNNNYGTHNKKQSESNKGKHNHCGKNNPRAKAVLMFTLDGEFIRRFDCIKEALIFLGKHNGGSNIHKCAVGVYKQAYGYKWIEEGGK